tara:strand:- start:4274 stop:5029 length:756 start_codon:yes stop_codon:yes gene_type:complete
MKKIKKQEIKAKAYKLCQDATPLSYTIASRNSRRFSLLHWDEEQGINRPLRYARNQKSPFEDEQDGNAILEPVVFEDGFLRVPRTNQVLQQFLALHPQNKSNGGTVFEEINTEKDAEAEIEVLNAEVDALITARQMDLDQVLEIGRVLFGDISKISTKEIKRDLLVYARRDPQGFLNLVDDPMVKLQSKIQTFFDNKLLVLRNKDVYYNTKSNKKRMLVVPQGEKPLEMVALYLQSDDGIQALKMLENKLD